VAVSVGGLRLIQREIRVAQQLVGAAAFADGDADARGQRQRPADIGAQHVRLAQHFHDPLRDELGAALILCAYLLKRLDDSGWFSCSVHPLLYVAGYGARLCTITVGGYIAELRGAQKRWEKTEKVGRVGELST
jgi:hypothetical protein